MLATWTLTALKLDLRKPGFCLLRTFGKGEGTGKGPKTQVGWPRLLTENLVQRQDFEKVSAHPGHQRLEKVPCSMEEAGTELTKCCSQWRPQQPPAHPVCSWRGSLPHLCHLGFGEVKLGVWKSGPGRNSAKPTPPFSPLSRSENVLDQGPWIAESLQKLLHLRRLGEGSAKEDVHHDPGNEDTISK